MLLIKNYLFFNLKDLFELAKNDRNVFIYVSFYQIYMEHINDLIGQDKKRNLQIKVNILQLFSWRKIQWSFHF